MFDRFLEMFRNISMDSIMIIVGIVIVIILIAILIARARSKRGLETLGNKRNSQNLPASKIKSKSQAVNVTITKMRMPIRGTDKWADAPLYISDKDRKAMGGKATEEATEKSESLGDFPAYIVRLDGSLDYDLIQHPLGDVFIAEPSMPKSGACYFVREISAGVYESYDPRTAPLASDETPVKAWFATHWDIVRQVFSVPTPWYKSISLWIAAIVGVAAFIIALATIGG